MIKSIRCFLICIAGLLGGIATAQVGPPWPQTITSQPPPPPAQQIAMDPIFGPLCAGPFGPGLCLEVNRFLQVQYARNQIQVPFLPWHRPDGRAHLHGTDGTGALRTGSNIHRRTKCGDDADSGTDLGYRRHVYRTLGPRTMRRGQGLSDANIVRF